MGSPAFLLLVLAVSAGAFAQRTTGIGFTLLVAPACAIVLDPDVALGTVVRLAVAADLLVLLGDRSAFDWQHIRGYLVPAAAAVPLAAVAIRLVPAPALIVVGAISTAAAAVVLLRARPESSRGATTSPLPSISGSLAGTRAAGFASGFFGVTTGMSGPPLALHASISKRPMSADRATMTVFFLGVDLAALLAHPRSTATSTTAVLLVVLGCGALVGGWAVTRVSDSRLRRVIPPLVLASACAALVSVLS